MDLIYEGPKFKNINDLRNALLNGEKLNLSYTYELIKNSSAVEIAPCLDYLNSEERQILLDLDTWKKDRVNVNNFDFWIETYASSRDQVKEDFVTSESFLFYLKQRFNIWTFDEEDPLYPDHDNYFLSEDRFFLFEYSNEYKNFDEAKHLLKVLYGLEGIDKTQQRLIRLLADSCLLLEEDFYRFKKGRLAEYGHIDYYEALEKTHAFKKQKDLDFWIKDKLKSRPYFSSSCENLILSSLDLVENLREDLILDEMNKIKNKDLLQFNFSQMLNSLVVLYEDEYDIKELSLIAKSMIQLSIDYLKKNYDISSVFEYFSFIDLIKIYHSLVQILWSEVKIEEKHQSFLGEYFSDILSKERFLREKTKYMSSFIDYKKIREKVQFLKDFYPYAKKLFETYQLLLEKDFLKDEYYLNYKVNELDVENLLITSFFNYCLGDGKSKKIGISVEDFHKVTCLLSKGKSFKVNNLKLLKEYCESFLVGLNFVDDYFVSILNSHLEGLCFKELEKEEFKFIGGPILYNFL